MNITVTSETAKYNNQCNNFYKVELHEWNTLNFRSKAEIKIAQELEKLDITFMPNAVIRIKDITEKRINIEVDFLINYGGIWSILEVDGDAFHSAEKDQERDTLLNMRTRLQTFRFNAIDCYLDPSGVIAKFKDVAKTVVTDVARRNPPSAHSAPPVPPICLPKSKTINNLLVGGKYFCLTLTNDASEVQKKEGGTVWKMFISFLKEQNPSLAAVLNQMSIIKTEPNKLKKDDNHICIAVKSVWYDKICELLEQFSLISQC